MRPMHHVLSVKKDPKVTISALLNCDIRNYYYISVKFQHSSLINSCRHA
jgi:hypothetical protein